MKIVYISNPSFFDMDLSLTKELFQQTDLYFFIDLPPYSRKSTALDFKTVLNKAGIYPATDFDELKEFTDYIDLNRTLVIYRTSEKTYSASNLLLQYTLARAIQKINPNVIHCNNFLNFNFTYFLYTNRIPKILTVHDPIPHSGESSKKHTAISQLNYKFFNNIILLNTSQTEAYLINFGKTISNLFFSRLGSYSYFQIYNQSKYIKKRNQILFFGRISPYKGIEELCRAFRLVATEFTDAKLIIAGSGEYDFNINPFLVSPNYVFLNRYIPNAELVQLIQESQFVVCPYKDATQSGVIMTSFALDQPVVATNVGGLKEMIIHNQTGLLIEPNNIPQLANSIKWMFQNPDVIEKMRENIKFLNINGNISWNKIVKGLVSIYSRLN